ncbi:hypothetical protein P20495_3217 [Pseudoalteromonas sp. BSi20495]|nr:hypothetical protein P20495_3217 [Pseudoalteromonas sp. BSi20495]
MSSPTNHHTSPINLGGVFMYVFGSDEPTLFYKGVILAINNEEQ